MLHINSLPDDILAARIFGALDFAERLTLALVCRRWARLAVAPELIRRLELNTSRTPWDGSSSARVLQRIQSFSCWFMRHAAAHVHELDLHIDRGADMPVLDEVMGVLAACSAAGGLHTVRLHLFGPDVQLPAWLTVALRSVRVFSLEVEECSLMVDMPLTGMSQLQALTLDSTPPSGGDDALVLSPAARLPTSLTSLKLCWSVVDPSQAIPAQVAALPQLRHLHMVVANCTQEAWRGLTALAGSLERLALEACDWIPTPATLESLTRLTSLDVGASGLASMGYEDEAVMEELEAALLAVPELRQLRISLQGCAYAVDLPAFPMALTSLSHLHSFWCTSVTASSDLPAGPWLGNLRRLVLPYDLINRNKAALAALHSLEYLGMLRPEHSMYASDSWGVNVQHFAEERLNVRRLDVDIEYYSPPLQFVSPRRPNLLITHTPDLWRKSFTELEPTTGVGV